MKNLIWVGIAFLFLASCSTSSGFLDIAMPDRVGLGQAFGKGKGRSRSQGTGGEFSSMENSNYTENTSAIWLEWDIPSINSDHRSSLADMRNRMIDDYTNFREPKKDEDSLVSITKHSVMDEETGQISETWDFGVSSAIYSAITAFVTYFGFRLLRGRGSKPEGNVEEEVDI